jgi:ribonuclease P protein component
MPRIARQISLFKAKEIPLLFKKSRLVLRHPGLDIYVAKTTTLPGRVLTVTPKKVGTAPQRNRARRRIKALFYEEKLYLLPYTVIIVCRKGIDNISFEQLKSLITTTIRSLS